MKNVIFDFGNVLVRWEPEKIYAAHFGDEAKAWWFLRHSASASCKPDIPTMPTPSKSTVRIGARCSPARCRA